MVRAATVEVATCPDWETAVDATLTEDTTAIVTSSFFTFADCGESIFKTLEVKNNNLRVVSDVASRTLVQFLDIRFEVTNNARLAFTMNAEFTLTEDKEPVRLSSEGTGIISARCRLLVARRACAAPISNDSCLMTSYSFMR